MKKNKYKIIICLVIIILSAVIIYPELFMNI